MVNVSKKGIKNKKKILLISASVLFLVAMLFCFNKFIYGSRTIEYNAIIELSFEEYPDPSLKISDVTAKATIKYYDVKTYKYLDTHTDETEGIDISYTWYEWIDSDYSPIETDYDTTYFKNDTTYKVVPKVINTTLYYGGLDVSSATIKFSNPRLFFQYDDSNYNNTWRNDHSNSHDVEFYILDLVDKDYYVDINDTNITLNIDQLLNEIESNHIALSGLSYDVDYDSLIELPSGLDVELKNPGSDSLTNVAGYYMDSTGSYYPNSDDMPDDASHTGLYNISLEIKPKNSNYAFTYPDTITINEKKNGVIVNERVLTTDESNFYYSKWCNGISYEQSTIEINYMYDTKENVFICFNPINDIDSELRYGYGDNYVEVAKNTEIDLPEFPDDGIYYEGYVHSKEQASPYGTISIDGKFIPYYSMPLYMLPVINMQITEQPTKENSYTVKTNVSDKSPAKPTYTWQKVNSEISNFNHTSSISEFFDKLNEGTLEYPLISPFDYDYDPYVPSNKFNDVGELESFSEDDGTEHYIYSIGMHVITKQEDPFEFNIVNVDGTPFDKSEILNIGILPFIRTLNEGVISILDDSEYNVKIDFSKQNNLEEFKLYDDINIYFIGIISNKDIKVQFKDSPKIYDQLSLYKDYIHSNITYPGVMAFQDNIELFGFGPNRLNEDSELESFLYHGIDINTYYIGFTLLTDKSQPFEFNLKDEDDKILSREDLDDIQIYCFYNRHSNIVNSVFNENEDTHTFKINYDGLDDSYDKPMFNNGKEIFGYKIYITSNDYMKLEFINPNDITVYDNLSLKENIKNNTMSYPAIVPMTDIKEFNFGPNTINDNCEIKSFFDEYGNNDINTLIAIDPKTTFSIDIEGIDDYNDLYISLCPISLDAKFDLVEVCELKNNNTLVFNLINNKETAYYDGPFKDDNIYLYNLYMQYDKPFKIKFKPILNKTYTYISDNDNVLSTESIESGEYRCEVNGVNYDLNYLSNSTPITLYSHEVTYTKENTPGGGGSSGGGSSHKKKDDEKKEEPKVEEPIQVENKNKSYMNGYEDKTFKPNSNVARQEVATILARISELFSDTSSYTSYLNKYNDVRYDDWYSNYLGFISKENILQGYFEESGTAFHPKDNMTRAEFATAVVRMFNLKDDTNKKCNLTDISGKWYEKNVSTLYSLGLINGYEDNTFRGNQGITRAEVCKIINAATKRYIKDSTNITSEEVKKLNNMFTDISSKDWFYYDVLTATVDFTYSK